MSHAIAVYAVTAVAQLTNTRDENAGSEVQFFELARDIDCHAAACSSCQAAGDKYGRRMLRRFDLFRKAFQCTSKRLFVEEQSESPHRFCNPARKMVSRFGHFELRGETL
ncbi:hypothetical protein D9M70_585810 [compost metagenome]